MPHKLSVVADTETALVARPTDNEDETKLPITPLANIPPELFNSFWVEESDLPEPMTNETSRVELSRETFSDVSGHILTNTPPVPEVLCTEC